MKHKPNSVDDKFKTKVKHALSRIGNLQSKRWSRTLHEAVLVYSDQLSLMGIALLVSGISQLFFSLDTYHWQLTFDLAWFTSITHLTTITCLRHYFHKQPALRNLRIVYMAIIGSMLSVSLLSAGFIGSDADPSFPAYCLFRPRIPTAVNGKSTYNVPYVSITFAFLHLSYLIRTLQLFPTRMTKVRRRFQGWPSKLLKGPLTNIRHHAMNSPSTLRRIIWASTYRLLVSAWCVLIAMSDLWSSMLWEVVENPNASLLAWLLIIKS